MKMLLLSDTHSSVRDGKPAKPSADKVVKRLNSRFLDGADDRRDDEQESAGR